jgi:predicted RNA-binding Zn-ribbon protein involved in translation (DUF1610 family)
MSDLIDKLVEGAGQVISEVDKGGQFQSAIGGIRQRMADADRRRRVTHIKQQLQDLRAREAQAINALSAQVLALHEAGSLTQPELVSLCRGVDEVRGQIKEKEAELEQWQPAAPQPAAPESPRPAAGARCPNCGVAVISGAAFCQSCGTRLQEEEPPSPVLYCVRCGAPLREGARFCPQCGQSLPQS